MIDMYKELCAGMYVLVLHDFYFAVYFRTLTILIFFSFLSPCVLEYPIVFIEDPFDKEDWEHTKYFSSLGICQVQLGFPC